MKSFIKLLIFLLLFLLVGCSNSVSYISLNGSSSMEKLSRLLIESYIEKNKDIVINVEFTGSGAGIQSVANGTSNIGNSSRYLNQDELKLGIVENVVALDSLGIIVDEGNSLKSLTNEELISIFTGEVRNWKELGGNDQNIVVIGRESGSGTRDAFESILNISEKVKYAQEIDSTGAVVAKVSVIPGAIGYVSLNVVSDSVKVLNINGISPTEENILNSSYTLVRPFIMATNQSIENQNQKVKDFFDFIYSKDGSDLIKKIGLIPVSQNLKSLGEEYE